MDVPEDSEIKCRWCMKASSKIFVCLVPKLEAQNGDHGSETEAPSVKSCPPLLLPHLILFSFDVLQTQVISVQSTLGLIELFSGKFCLWTITWFFLLGL